MERLINVYATGGAGDIVGKVAVNEILGQTLWGGLARLETGEWVFILTHNYTSPRDKAYVITAEEALMEILERDREELLDLPEFADLKKLDKREIRKQMYAARGWE